MSETFGVNGLSTHRCGSCTREVDPGARFCQSCGSDLDRTVVQEVVPAGAPQGPESGWVLDQLRRATLGEYDVLNLLGRGGMATVYLAHDISLDRKVAIKVMSPELHQTKGMAERFLLEARTAAQLSHPNIIPIYAVKSSGSLLYFVMKFVEGTTLDAVIAERGALPVPLILTILEEVGSALEYAHRKGVVHRDIKPANILIDDEGRAVVTDFGIAKVKESGGLTLTGAAIGTPSYMSPEQCTGAEVTGASDQYSLGMVAYEMVTGRAPFAGGTLMSLMWSQVHEAPEPIASIRNDCPRLLELLIARMIEKDPTHRWCDMDAVTSALNKIEALEKRGASKDAIREELMTMARTGIAVHVRERATTPRSPVPVVEAKPPPELSFREPAGEPAWIHVEPLGGVLCMGDRYEMTAVLKDDQDRTLPEVVVSWQSSDPSVLTVDPDGIITAQRSGEAVVTASVGDLTATERFVVSRVGISSLKIRQSRSILRTGEELQLEAVPFDTLKRPVPGRVIVWNSSNPEVATVSSLGKVTALGEGTAEIEACCSGRTATATVVVRPVAITSLSITPADGAMKVGGELIIKAIARDARNRQIPVNVTWRSSNPQVAHVSDEGVVTGMKGGSAIIVASAGNKRATARVTVFLARMSRR